MGRSKTSDSRPAAGHRTERQNRALPAARLLPLLALLGAAGALQAATARAVTIATEAKPTPVSAFRGRLVWSHYDAASRRYKLMTRFEGATSEVPVNVRRVPFDADLGPTGRRDTVAVYSRCRREAAVWLAGKSYRRLALPRGCDLYAFNFASGRERRLRAISSSASEYLPTLWRDRIAYVRVASRGPRRPDLYVEPATGGRAKRLPGGQAGSVATPGPVALDLAGDRLAFAWQGVEPPPDNPQFHSTVRIDRLRGGQTVVADVASGALSTRLLLSPAFSRGDLYFAERSDTNRRRLNRYLRFDPGGGTLTSARAEQPWYVAWTARDRDHTYAQFNPGWRGVTGCAAREGGEPRCELRDEGGPEFR